MGWFKVNRLLEFTNTKLVNHELLFPDVRHETDELEARLLKGNVVEENFFEFSNWLNRADGLHWISGVGLSGIICHVIDQNGAGTARRDGRAQGPGSRRGNIDHKFEVAPHAPMKIGPDDLPPGRPRERSWEVAIAAEFVVGLGLPRCVLGLDPTILRVVRNTER